MQQEQMKNEVNIPDIGSRAEIVLENNHDNVEHFERDINRVYENLFDETRR
jgi:hypothetical protein